MNNEPIEISKKKQIVFSLVFLFLFFLILEICARLWLFCLATPIQFSKYAMYDEVPLVNRLYSPHHYLNYCLTPNYRSLDGMNRHNTLGYRGDEIQMPKPKGIFRIAILGGSTVYTESVKDYRQSFPYLLQNILHEKYGYNVDVINAGVGGYTSFESLINFEFRVLDLDPDLVIVYHATNDVHARLVLPDAYKGDNSGYRKQWRRPERYIYEEIVFLRILSYAFHLLPNRNYIDYYIKADTAQALSVRDDYNDVIKGRPSEVLVKNRPIYFERNMRNMVAIANENNIKFVIATWAHSPLFPNSYSSAAHYVKAYEDHNNILRKIAAEDKVPLFDFERKMPLDKEYWADGRHVNEKGAMKKAELFAEFLDENGLIGKK